MRVWVEEPLIMMMALDLARFKDERKGSVGGEGENIRGKNRGMLMHAHPPHDAPLLHRLHRADLVPPAQIPQLHLTIPTPGDEFA